MQDYPTDGVLLASIVLATLFVLRLYQKLFREAEKRAGQPFPLGMKVVMVPLLPIAMAVSFLIWLLSPTE